MQHDKDDGQVFVLVGPEDGSEPALTRGGPIHSEHRPGRVPALRHLVAGCWRSDSLTVPDQDSGPWKQLIPLLRTADIGPLGWARLRAISWDEPGLPGEMHDLYREAALRLLLQQQEIRTVVNILADVGIESILVKGWASARRYADPVVRPLGDIDLLLPPVQLSLAIETLAAHHRTRFGLDLVHDYQALLEGGDQAGLWERTDTIDLDGTSVRILGAEDDLAFMCLHFLKEGAWRPFWLCDVAALLESLPPHFDWRLCLGKDPRRTDMIATTVGLARHLLGARPVNMPAALDRLPIPAWVERAVLKQWERPLTIQHRERRVGRAMDTVLGHPI